MSSARGSGTPRGRGRGSTQLWSRGRGRGASTSRGRVFSNATPHRGNPTVRAGAGFGQQTRGNAGQAARGPSNTRGDAFAQAASRREAFGATRTGGSWQERYQKLTKARDREREDAIRQGVVADPEKPRALSEAVTPTGTCQDMCAEYERVQRVVQDDVWKEEKGDDGEPDESRMVKKFRRSAAGLEEQLPSDLRSPPILKRTCDYLFDEVIGNAPSLAKVHHFVWDRTRAIRNDFSIQQLTKLDDLRIAVECYERIARFHILSLHQLASPERPYAKYDWSQEREQLDRTLLSLMQYYEDTRNRIEFPNEAEFRAYCVISQLRSPTPDLEDVVQVWPRAILRDRRVRRALKVYAAGCTTMGQEGPMNPKVSHLLARQDWQGFWVLVASNEVSYLMGCAAEVYFNSIRRMVLNALFRTFRANINLPTPELTLDVLCELFAFDEDEEVQAFCQFFGFAFKVREDGQSYLDLSSVSGRVLPMPNTEMPNQLKSSLVENKRLGRTLPSVINGMTVQQAQEAGLVVEEEHDEGMEDVDDGGEENAMASMDAGQPTESDEDSLFIPEDNKAKAAMPNAAPPLTNGFGSQPNPSPFSFGKPSGATESPFSTPTSTVQPSETASKPKFDFLGGGAKAEGTTASDKPSFNFLGGASKPAEKAPASTSGFNFLQAATKPSDTTTDSKPAFSFPGSTAAPASISPSAPKFDFTSGAALGGFGKTSQELSGQTKDSNGETTASRKQDETAPQQNGIFSNAAQGQAGTPAFNFAPPAPAKPSSPERTTAIPQPPAVVPKATSGFKPATVESAPSSEESNNPFLQPQPKSPAQTPAETPSFPSHSKQQAQPHYTAPSANVPPSFSNPPPSPPQLNTGLRRPSTSTDTKPKKPSPLANSFTATDDSTSSVRGPSPPSRASATEKPLTHPTPPLPQNQLPKFQQVNAPSPTDDSQLKKPVPFKRPRRPSEERVENFDATVTRIAKELVEDPVSGYLKQYVEYRASQIITSVQEEIAAEKMKFRLSELRISTLYRKYVKRWVNLVWQKRLAKSGKDRRQRRRKRLEEGFDDGSSVGNGSVRGTSPGSVAGSNSWKDHQENVDAVFQRTMNSRSLARPMPRDQQARAGSKRPTSSHGENGTISRASAHKRLKSTSHVDDRGRISKPTATATSHLNDDILKRSSFLGFSVNGPSPPNKNTTKSNYFRLKAMGVHRADELSAPRGTKRSRTESAQPAATSPPHLRKSISGAGKPEDSTTRSLMPPPSTTVSRAQKMKEEDDALFARIRAARESLTVGAVYMKEEVAKDDELRRSLGSSHSSTESPSMIKARAEARSRASRAGSPERDVPAYRLRESKFVPREQYGKAIERSREMRESRSRDTSRPASRPESRLDQPTGETVAQAPGFSFSAAFGDSQKSQGGPPNGLPAPKPAAESMDLNVRPPNYSPLERPAHLNFDNHTTEMSNSNPFLPSTVLDPSATSNYNPYTPFGGMHTQKSSEQQPSYGSKPTFGTQSGFGTGSAFGSQTPFTTQQHASRYQSGFGSLPAANSHLFGSAFASSSKTAFGGQNVQSSFAAPQDQTIQPELIDQSLANSFGNHREEGHADDSQSHHNYPVPPQQNSYMNTQISLLSDDDDDDGAAPPTHGIQQQANPVSKHESEEELLDQATDDEEQPQPPYGHANPFDLLADQNDYDESPSNGQVTGDEMYDQDQFDHDEEQMGNGFESQEDFSNDGDVGFDDGYYGGDDEEGANGDVDEDNEADEDADGFDSEDDEEDEEETEEEATAPPPQPWKKVEYPDPWRAKPVPAPNSALQSVGKTEDTAIELDSD